ncbi:MAG: DMT family transporter [Coriobacteriia bacterium]|nr:DMT family transporter [Coriobacteriia bacterium]
MKARAAPDAVSLAAALAVKPVVDVATIEPVAWGVIAFLAILSTCVTFALQNVALTGLPSSTVSLLLTGEPVFTALFSMALLGEFLSIGGWVGAGIILVAVVGATLVEGRDGNLEASSGAGMGRLVSQLASDSNAQ